MLKEYLEKLRDGKKSKLERTQALTGWILDELADSGINWSVVYYGFTATIKLTDYKDRGRGFDQWVIKVFDGWVTFRDDTHEVNDKDGLGALMAALAKAIVNYEDTQL